MTLGSAKFGRAVECPAAAHHHVRVWFYPVAAAGEIMEHSLAPWAAGRDRRCQREQRASGPGSILICRAIEHAIAANYDAYGNAPAPEAAEVEDGFTPGRARGQRRCQRKDRPATQITRAGSAAQGRTVKDAITAGRQCAGTSSIGGSASESVKDDLAPPPGWKRRRH